MNLAAWARYASKNIGIIPTFLIIWFDMDRKGRPQKQPTVIDKPK